MPSLEYVVRPYQSPNANGAIIIPSTPTLSTERATLTWGGSGSGQATITNDGPNWNVTCCDENLKEDVRQEQPIRVYQDGDTNSSNYVDVARPTKMRMGKNDQKNCGEDAWLQMSFAAASVDEILQGFANDLAPFDESQSQCKADWTFTYKKGGTPVAGFAPF